MSEDLVYIDAREWTPELNDAARRLHEEGGLFRDVESSEETVWEYPIDTSEMFRFPFGSFMHTVGFVYVLSNPAQPGVVKVGKTTKLAEDRAAKLRTTGVPVAFKVEFRAATSRASDVEQRGDRIALTLEAGQLFVLLSYPSSWRPRPRCSTSGRPTRTVTC